MSTTHDSVQRFFFDDCDARGELVKLSDTYICATEHQALSPQLQQLLGEFLAATSILAGILKFKGKLTLQAQGDGAIKLIMADITNRGKVRGVLRTRNDDETKESAIAYTSLPELIGNGTLSITIEPEQGQRYQGIIPLEHENLAENLSAYFTMSEQLPTFIFLCANNNSAAGILAQAMPSNSQDTLEREGWETVKALVATITKEEMLELPTQVILHRLFSELKTRVSEAKNIKFECGCSREKSALAITSIGLKEATELLIERDLILIHCEFCGADYSFGQADLDEIFEVSNIKH